MTTAKLFRFGSATLRKLETLAQLYGSEASAVRVAIERLWLAETHTRKETTMKTEKLHIDVQFSEASLWGCTDPEEYDQVTSEANYMDSLINHIYDAYPDAGVTVQKTINDWVRVGGLADHPETEAIEAIIDTVWNGDSWLTPAQDSD